MKQPMTAPTLTSQLRLLAEAAGVEYGETVEVTAYTGSHPTQRDFKLINAPGHTGTLDVTEVGVVLGWLAKAGFTYRGMKYKDGPYVLNVRADGVAPVEGRAFESPEAALTAAVIALPLEGEVTS